MSIRALYIGDVPKKDTGRPGDLRPGEVASETRTVPAPIPAAMWKDHKDSGRGYGAFRPKQGNGTWHWGLDLPAGASEPIISPERAVIVAVWTDNSTAPFVGYGPGGVLLRGLTTGVHHLLGHLDPSAWSSASRPTKAEVFERGQLVGHTAPTGSDGVGRATPHVHWEVRVQPIDSPDTRKANTLDPIEWVQGNAVTLTDTASSPGIPWWVWLLGAYALGKRRG